MNATSFRSRRLFVISNHVARSILNKREPAACKKTAWQVHAYYLVSNHFDLVVETPRTNLA